MQMCIFPECMDGDSSFAAFTSASNGACDKCRVLPRQYAAHVRAWEEHQFRRRVGLMVLQPYPIVAVTNF